MSSELIKKSKENNFQYDLYRDDIVIERKGSGLLNIISITNIFFLSSVIFVIFFMCCYSWFDCIESCK
jgi:hypothetical protein